MADIHFVYFDLGNVLVAFDPALACSNVARLFGISPELAESIVYHSGLEPQLERGELTGEQFAAEVRARVAALADRRTWPDAKDPHDVSTEALLDAISDMFTPIDTMRSAVAGVRATGRRVGILSNTCEAHWAWCARQAYPVLAGPFDVSVLSCRIGAMKPDPVIYAAAERDAGVAPEQILFLDDKPENVEAARRRGWQAERCDGGPSAIEILQALGLVAHT